MSGLSQNEVDKINEDLYPYGQIFWVEGERWSSKLWQNLTKHGVRTSNNHGLITVYAPDGSTMGTWIGRVGMLVGVSKVMR